MDTEEKKQQAPSEIDGTNAVARAARIAVGVMVVLVFLVGSFIFFRLHAEEPAEVPQQSLEDRIGVADVQKIFKNHKDYARLQQLQQDVKTLEADIATERMNMKFTPPEPDKKVMEEGVKQEQHLDMVTHFTKKLDELNQKEAKLREDMKPKFEAEIREIEKTYLNDILNIRLKLDNAKEMRLTEDEVDAMLKRMEELQHSRGEAVMKKKAAQEEQIQNVMQADRLALKTEIDKYNADNEARLRAEYLKKETEAQERNAKAMEQASVVPVANNIRIAQKKALLMSKKQEIKALEKHIMKDISGLAAKLAIMNKLTLIVASTAVNPQGEDYYENGFGEWQPLHTPVIGINTIDLTEALLDELKNSPDNEQQDSNAESGKEENSQ